MAPATAHPITAKPTAIRTNDKTSHDPFAPSRLWARRAEGFMRVIIETSPSLTMSALSSILCAHDRMHSEKSGISLYQLVLRFPTWLALNG